MERTGRRICSLPILNVFSCYSNVELSENILGLPELNLWVYPCVCAGTYLLYDHSHSILQIGGTRDLIYSRSLSLSVN